MQQKGKGAVFFSLKKNCPLKTDAITERRQEKVATNKHQEKEERWSTNGNLRSNLLFPPFPFFPRSCACLPPPVSFANELEGAAGPMEGSKKGKSKIGKNQTRGESTTQAQPQPPTHGHPKPQNPKPTQPRRRPTAARLFLLVLHFFAAILPHQDISPANGQTAQKGRESRRLTNKRRQGKEPKKRKFEEATKVNIAALLPGAYRSLLHFFCV